MSEFKGTKGTWTRYTASVPSMNRPTRHSVYAGTKRIAMCFDLFCNDKSENVEEQEGEYNALLISKAPQMLEMLEIVCNELYRTDNEMATQVKKLIKEATELK